VSADARQPDKKHAWRDGFVTVRDGLKLHYRDYPGSAARPPLLCLHGLTRNSSDFAEFAERYSPRFRVIALDFRGRGRSDYDPRPSRYTPLIYAGDVIRLLDDLGLGSAIFVGTSLGGLVTMTMAAMAPSRIAAAILNDIGPEPNRVGLNRIMTYVGKDVRFKNWDEAAETIADNHGRLPASFTHADWLAMAKRNCREQDGEIVYDYDMTIAVPFKISGPAPRVDLWPLFSSLAQKPLLVVRGELSDLLSAASMEKMRLAAPFAKFAVVPGVAHAPTLGEPAAVAAIDGFLGSLDQ
jgi:pimeloyl-ACP methyl ester carboxylesterase